MDSTRTPQASGLDADSDDELLDTTDSDEDDSEEDDVIDVDDLDEDDAGGAGTTTSVDAPGGTDSSES